ncbi:MAG: hypothetical protein JWM86_1489 [Thermoleophilia bacterium]|nr:hypothetical protein [Thermoleophilia bacterium]
MSGTSAAPSTNSASARLATAITAARGSHGAPEADAVAEREAAPVVQPEPAPARPGGGCHHAASPSSVRDASRGASAGPGDVAGGGAPADGQRNVMSVAPNGLAVSGGGPVASGTPYTPEQASTDAYAAMSDSPEPAGVGGDVAPDPTYPSVGASSGVQGSAWSPQWEQRFQALHLAPADMEYLRSGGFDEATLASIAGQLSQVDVLDPSAVQGPIPNADAGSVSSADGPLPVDIGGGIGDGQPAGGSAWNKQWEQKFRDVMTRMGLSSAEVDAQLSGVQGQPTSEAQLTEALKQMESSVGAYDAEWKEKFGTLMDELKTPAKDKEQVLQQLAGTGLSEAQLQEAYRQMQASKPAWNSDWENKFQALDVPKEMLEQLKKSGAPADALKQQYDKLLETKMTYSRDGRLERLQDAKATSEEKWGIMLEGKSGKDFDKLVEQVKSSHVSGWQRVGSFALNLIPGVYAVQYLTGKDWVTGEKIDRSNPLNIIGAVASGFAGFTAVRSAVAGVQGLSAASRAATATMQAANAGSKASMGLAASVKAMGSASSLSTGSFQAIEAAGLVTKFEQGLRFTDYLKSAVPLINRFGEAGRLSAVGRGYTQGMQLAAGMAATKAVEGGGAVVDKAVKAGVLTELKQGRSLQEAMASVGRTSGTGGGYAFRAQDVLRDGTRYGFLQGSVGKAVDGARIGRGSGNWTMNPFKNTNTIASTNNPNVFSLGKSVNFGSTGGLAQGLGTVKAANVMANPGTAAQALTRAQAANQLIQNPAITGRLTGVNMVDEVQRIETLTKTSEWAQKLGVANGSRFRTLMQLGSSNRMASRVSNMVERGGSQGYRAVAHAGDVARRGAGFVATPIIGGAALGLTGKQMQPGWDYLKERDEIQAKEAAQAKVADQEQADLERLYAEQQTAGGGAPAAGQPQVAAQPQGLRVQGQGQALGQAQPAGAGASGVYVDPATGRYVDPATGLQADPATGNVYDPRSGQVVGNLNAA